MDGEKKEKKQTKSKSNTKEKKKRKPSNRSEKAEKHSRLTFPSVVQANGLKLSFVQSLRVVADLEVKYDSMLSNAFLPLKASSHKLVTM